MKKISDNISYKEATRSETAQRLGISNKPKKEHIENMELIADKIFKPLREWVDHPLRINRFYRSEELNSRIGGSLSSAHKDGLAMDLDSLGGKTNLEMFHYIKDNLEFDQLIWEFGTDKRPDWVHVSYNSNGKQRGQILVAKRNSKGKTYYENWSI